MISVVRRKILNMFEKLWPFHYPFATVRFNALTIRKVFAQRS